MKDEEKTKDEIIAELIILFQQIDQLGASQFERRRVEKALLESEKKYRTIFELSPEAIVLLDRRGNIVDVNGRVYDWLGYRPEEVVGMNLLELPFLPNRSKVKAKETFSRRMAGKNVSPYELNFIAKNGEKRIGRITATPIREKEGKVVQDLVMISDITGSKRAEEIIQHKLKFEKTMSSVSSRFMGSSDIDDAINSSLADIGGLSGASR